MKHVTYMGLDDRPVDPKTLVAALTEKEFRRQLNGEALWGYVCLVILMCLMMWTFWCLGGLQRCRCRPDNFFSFDDQQPLDNVHDVLKKTRPYLPMFAEPEGQEVVTADKGTDP